MQHGVGGWGFNIHGQQRQCLITVSYQFLEFSKAQGIIIYDPSGLLTKMKSHVLVNSESEDIWRIRDSQKGDNWTWSDKKRTEKRGRERHIGKRHLETTRNIQRSQDKKKRARDTQRQREDRSRQANSVFISSACNSRASFVEFLHLPP